MERINFSNFIIFNHLNIQLLLYNHRVGIKMSKFAHEKNARIKQRVELHSQLFSLFTEHFIIYKVQEEAASR